MPLVSGQGAFETVEKPVCRKRKNRRWRQSYEKTGGNQKFRIDPFLKGSRDWKGQSPFPGAYLPYFRS